MADRSTARTLILGFGNPDRQDDGAAWHIVRGLAERLGRTVYESTDGDQYEAEPSPILVCVLQLIPEMAEALSLCERVCFVDAHMGSYADPAQRVGDCPGIRFDALRPDYQISPFTHHLAPQSCLKLAALYGRAPQAVVCSIQGYEFGFAQSLSERTSKLVEEAVERICTWVETTSLPPV